MFWLSLRCFLDGRSYEASDKINGLFTGGVHGLGYYKLLLAASVLSRMVITQVCFVSLSN